jgi:hypothetical protein
MKTTSPVAKSFFIIFMALTFIPSIQLYSQACYNPYVDYIISQTSYDSVCRYNRELTGDTTTYIGGLPYLIFSRVYDSPANPKAAQYIFEKFTDWGMPARYQYYSDIGKNVIAYKTGTKYPNKQFIICAHYDNFTNIPSDTTHGADDNASGVCAVLEAARVLKPYTFDYTIVFIAFDEEELGLFGSKGYADSAFFRGDSIMGVINLDMIAYDSDNNNIFTVIPDTNSAFLGNVVYSSCHIYQPDLNPKYVFGSGGSDQVSFWQRGFKALCMIEDMSDFNRYYHTVEDNYQHLNLPYMHSIIKAAIASLIILEKDFIINFGHVPLVSTYDTTSRIAEVVITSNNNIARGFNSPRLYFKTESSGYTFLNAFYNNRDTYRFLIPGFSPGTVVNYYLAAQDSAQTMIGTSPGGGLGMSPPGTIPPPETFSYYILEGNTACSGNLPKSIPPHRIIYDSIYVDFDKMVYDLNVKVSINHIHDTDLYVSLVRAGYSQQDLSSSNGGQNPDYINTIFDDEADTLISNGTPPFTGRYRPESVLSQFDNQSTSGYWAIKILNMSLTDTARLTDWCIDFSYYNPIGITANQQPEKFSLSQNFPNPFNAMTKIKYNLLKQGQVNITVYDILGREVKVLINEIQKPGGYEIYWDAVNMPSGVYFYRLVHPDFTESRKMVLIK